MAPETIDPDSPVPLYHQIAEQIRASIEAGELAPGDILEPLRKAAETWNVNLHTIRHANAALARTGLVESGRGRRGSQAAKGVRADRSDVSRKHRRRADRRGRSDRCVRAPCRREVRHTAPARKDGRLLQPAHGPPRGRYATYRRAVRPSRDVRFIMLDSLVSNGFQSWARESGAQHGGWGEAELIVQIRPAYVNGPMTAWRNLDDPVRRQEDDDETRRESELDEERARATQESSIFDAPRSQNRSSCRAPDSRPSRFPSRCVSART